MRIEVKTLLLKAVLLSFLIQDKLPSPQMCRSDGGIPRVPARLACSAIAACCGGKKACRVKKRPMPTWRPNLSLLTTRHEAANEHSSKAEDARHA